MKAINVYGVQLQFDANEVTHGTASQQAEQAIEQINGILQRQPFGLGAQLIAHREEIDVTEETRTDGEDPIEEPVQIKKPRKQIMLDAVYLEAHAGPMSTKEVGTLHKTLTTLNWTQVMQRALRGKVPAKVLKQIQFRIS